MGNQRTGPRGEGNSGVPGLTDDGLYRVLASTRRRRLLSYLLEEGETTIHEAATVLTGWEATGTGEMASPDDRRTMLLELDHSHLPILEETGFASVDRESGTVELETVPSDVRDLVRRSVNPEGSPRS